MAFRDAFMSRASIWSGLINPSEAGLSQDKNAIVSLPDKLL
jgi:hypothetical protein